MARRGDVPTRGEVTEKVDHSADDMQEKAEEMDKVVEDIETVRQTLEELDLGGTSDGADEVGQSIEAAEDVTVDVFDREDEEVEQLQQDSSEYEGDLHERSDSVESDLGKALRKAHRDRWRKALGANVSRATTDVRYFNLYHNIPATCYGPKSENIHSADEKVSIDSMQRVSEVLASFTMDWCGVGKRRP